MKLNEMYQGLGISPAVYEYGEAVLKDLRERFDAIDQAAEYNQAKVLSAFQKNRVDAACFAATTGYGYNDVGREKLELVYADVFHTEAALVRPQITCGTHALTVALSANLLPGDEPFRRSSASAPPPAPWRSTASATGRWSCWQTVPLTTRVSGPPSTKRPSSSPSSAPRGMPPAPPSLWRRSGS